MNSFKHDSDRLIWVNLNRIKYHAAARMHWSLDFTHPDRQLFGTVNFYCDRSLANDNHPRVLIDPITAMPRSHSGISWDEATAARVIEVRNRLDLDPNLDLCVLWSGGIDSTFILASLILHLDRDYWPRVRVALTPASILENPSFYRYHILPNFRTQAIGDDQTHALVIDGSLGDKLICNELMIRWALNEGASQRLPFAIDRLITFLDDYIGDGRSHAVIWEKIAATATASGIHLDTVGDALWWLGFNFAWVGMYYDKIGLDSIYHDITVHQIRQGISWFASESYQDWAMGQTGRLATGNDLWHTYKQPCKDLIYQVDQNQFYQRFKLKTVSNSRSFYQIKLPIKQWTLAVNQDGQRILTSNESLENDLLNLGW